MCERDSTKAVVLVLEAIAGTSVQRGVWQPQQRICMNSVHRERSDLGLYMRMAQT